MSSNQDPYNFVLAVTEVRDHRIQWDLCWQCGEFESLHEVLQFLDKRLGVEFDEDEDEFEHFIVGDSANGTHYTIKRLVDPDDLRENEPHRAIEFAAL